MTITCFYHRGDLDGKCSAAVVKRAFPDTTFMGVDYNEAFPFSADVGEGVVMVDFGIQPMSDMVRYAADLKSKGKAFTWIDHHKTAMEEAEKADFNPMGLRRIGSAACELCWEYFFKNEPMPEGVKLLGRYDVFDLKDPRTVSFQFGMRGEPTQLTDPIWNHVLSSPELFILETCYKGMTIKKYQDKQNLGLAKQVCFEMDFEGMKTLAANAHGNSMFFDGLEKSDAIEALCLFHYENGTWVCSLYGIKEGTDVSVAAKKYGGGGHAKAAGFSCAELPFTLPGKQAAAT